LLFAISELVIIGGFDAGFLGIVPEDHDNAVPLDSL